jgi:hypothetical protein
VTDTGEFSFRTSYAAQKITAELAFALLRMQAATPADEWVDEHFPREYREVRERAASLAGHDAADDLLLAALIQSEVVLAYLTAATGLDEAEWLDRIGTDFVGHIPSSGIGVWGPRELRLGD